MRALRGISRTSVRLSRHAGRIGFYCRSDQQRRYRQLSRKTLGTAGHISDAQPLDAQPLTGTPACEASIAAGEDGLGHVRVDVGMSSNLRCWRAAFLNSRPRMPSLHRKDAKSNSLPNADHGKRYSNKYGRAAAVDNRSLFHQRRLQRHAPRPAGAGGIPTGRRTSRGSNAS
jgi:hypothetical protein